MGGLLSIPFFCKEKQNNVPGIIIDLQLAEPTPEELTLYNHATLSLKPATQILQEIQAYAGCGELIRNAITSPGPAADKNVWNELVPSVRKLHHFYEFSFELQKLLPQLLSFFIQGDVQQNMIKGQAIVKKLTDIIHFVSLFDEFKMLNPNIQNDFSYYKRSIVKFGADPIVSEEVAGRMSLFYANPGPMTKALIEVVQSSPKIEAFIPCFSLIAAITHNLLDQNLLQDAQMKNYCLRVMVIAIIIYDHVDAIGAFSKHSQINIKSCVRIIKEQGENNTAGLMNGLKYSTLHLKDESTSNKIKSIILD